jgi:FkbM family methyltransferase
MVIYDFGANEGQNFQYFLSKGYKVVGIEANPTLCDEMNKKFSKEIADKRVVVVNCCLSDESDDEVVDFYVHNEANVLSQFNKPEKDQLSNFSKIQVKTKKPSSIVKEYGEPYYIKIDIEHYDVHVLKELISSKIFPKFISVEAHDPDVLKLLIESKRFKRYNVVKGESLSQIYPQFDFHSSGPLGTDLKSPWLDENGINELFGRISFGWLDIHASTEDLPAGKVNLSFYIDKYSSAKYDFSKKYPSLYRFLNKVNRARYRLLGRKV